MVRKSLKPPVISRPVHAPPKHLHAPLLPTAKTTTTTTTMTNSAHSTSSVAQKKRQRVISGPAKATAAAESGAVAESESATVPSAEIKSRAVAELADLLMKIGVAFAHLKWYRCSKAIEAFNELPPEQWRSGWVLIQRAAAATESANPEEAIALFREAHASEPHRLQGMHLYASALWVNKLTTELTILAADLRELDRQSAITWVAVGSLFSLQKEAHKAMQCYRRALRIDTTFDYAYMLLGHEYYDMNDFPKAQAEYKLAIRCDPRQYKAYYGIGLVNVKLQKYKWAEFNLRKATDIHCTYQLLWPTLASCLRMNGNYPEAKEAAKRGRDLDEKDSQARSILAEVYVEMGLYDEAMDELKNALLIKPKSGILICQLGSLYARLGRNKDALQQFNHALFVDPSSSHTALDAISKVDVTNSEPESGAAMWEDFYKMIAV